MPTNTTALLNTAGLLKKDGSPATGSEITITLAQMSQNLTMTIAVNEPLYCNMLTTTSAWTVDEGYSATLAGLITARPFIKNGAGVGVLSPAAESNIYGVNVEAGIVEITGDYAGTTINGPITVSSGATFQMANGVTLSNAVSFQ